MDRIYDLNDRQKCVTAVLKISDKEYRISRVVTGVRVLYSNMLIEMGEQLKAVGSLDTKTASDEEIKEALEKADAFKERRKTDKNRCLELLLVKNGYEFDRTWWEDNADEYDITGTIPPKFPLNARRLLTPYSRILTPRGRPMRWLPRSGSRIQSLGLISCGSRISQCVSQRLPHANPRATWPVHLPSVLTS